MNTQEMFKLRMEIVKLELFPLIAVFWTVGSILNYIIAGIVSEVQGGFSPATWTSEWIAYFVLTAILSIYLSAEDE